MADAVSSNHAPIKKLSLKIIHQEQIMIENINISQDIVYYSWTHEKSAEQSKVHVLAYQMHQHNKAKNKEDRTEH